MKETKTNPHIGFEGSDFRIESIKTRAENPAVAQQDESLELLYKVGRKVEAEPELSRLLNDIMQMTQDTLQASASSILLVDETSGELFFEAARGKAGNTLTETRFKIQAGIAPWVVEHNEGVIVNDVISDRRFNKGIDKKTGFSTKSIMCVPLVVGRKIIGALEVLNKIDGSEFGNKELELLTTLASYAALAIDNAKLNQAVVSGYMNTVKVLAAAIDAKDPYTYGHSQRVAEYALIGATTLSLSATELQVIEYGGILHDIGKIAVNENILRKPTRLDPEEWEIIHTHPSTGAAILDGVTFLNQTRELVLHHHERYDGTGYTSRLAGASIPIGARLLAVADAFDTMTTERSYRVAVISDRALDELRQCAGTQFCPEAVDAFIAGFRKRQHKPHLPSNSIRRILTHKS
ncbi:MAG: HD domain-containing protein [Chloroflexi bacterium]|nr:HD domain-containing protein [Chloroflexota bacterium]MBM4452002.1 HD domain-containing protein [Chloroflexota bacterium]